MEASPILIFLGIMNLSILGVFGWIVNLSRKPLDTRREVCDNTN